MTERAPASVSPLRTGWVLSHPSGLTAAWSCPNRPPCEHPHVTHDIYDFASDLSICCVEGCSCGRVPSL